MAKEEEEKYECPSNPFAIPNLWKSSVWLEAATADANSRSPLFSLHLSHHSHAPFNLVTGGHVSASAPSSSSNTGFFGLPSLLGDSISAQEDPIDWAPQEEEENVEVEVEIETHPDAVQISDDDMWLGTADVPARTPELKTWDKPVGHDHAQTFSATFITEAGPAAFDALLDSQKTVDHATSDVVDDASYASCLLALALGRNSLLFSWDGEKHSFVKTFPRLRTTGLSPQSMDQIDTLCAECGNAAKHLQSFAQKTFSGSPTPTRVALAGVVDRLVTGIRTELNYRGHATRSIIQLQSVVRPAHTVLTYFKKLVGKLAKQKSEEGILSLLFQEAQTAEYQNALLQEATREVLRLVSKPWINFVEEWVGLKAESGAPITRTGPGKGFVKVADEVWVSDLGYELEESEFFLDEDKLPSFMPGDLARTAFETGKNLRFLREHHPSHSLCNQQTVASSNPPDLEWKFTWDAITHLERKAREFHDALSRALETPSPGLSGAGALDSHAVGNHGYELAVFGQTDSQISTSFLESMRRLDRPLANHEEKNDLSTLLRDKMYPAAGKTEDVNQLNPHWSLAPLLSFGPVISVQSRLVNQECMKVLFGSHQLRVHIDTLKQYYLLNNGVLCSRLSHALFDTELETAERKAGVALVGGTMGLRLGGRESWPPASSELRLALMGVLSESYQPPPGYVREKTAMMTSRSFSSDLLGDLSFAVRDLSPDEVDRCMDPDSLEALDFLRLSYRAPAPLRPVVTPTILVKYDRIFMSLLRILRMLYVVNELFHDVPLAGRRGHRPSNASVRFCIEARHFVRQISAYFFESGITTPWRHFEAWLDKVEAESLRGRYQYAADGYSPDMVRERQEHVLDEIMTTLLLRKRQAPVLKLLEEAFAVILQFAKQLRVRTGAGGPGEQAMVRESPGDMYATFKKKVELFLTVCRGLGEKSGTRSEGTQAGGQDGLRQGDANPMERLLLLMDMSGFYTKTPWISDER